MRDSPLIQNKYNGMSRTIKEFIKLYAPLALGIIIVASWFLDSRNREYVLLEQQRQGTTVALGARIIARTIANRASDAQFLARMVSRYIQGESLNIRAIEDTFTDFARSRTNYFIIRFLDDTGMERVRVDRSFAGPIINPPSALQNKMGRYYVVETLKAGMNDVYISKFDLNVEHGRIEIPYRPTLRFGCPVIDKAGHKRGLIVLNLDGANMIDQIRIQADTGDGITMLSDGDGYWMLGPTPEDEWGNLLLNNGGPSMQNRFPVAWKSMTRTDKDQIKTPKGLFSFDTVGIIPDAVMSDVPPSVEQAKKRWKIMTWVPGEKLHVPWRNMYIFLVSLSTLMLSFGCWYLAEYRIRQGEVESRLRDNEERTLAISHSSQDAITMIDSEDRITHWNPAAEELFGYTEEEAMGAKLHELIVPPAFQERAKAGLKKFTNTGQGRVIDNVHEFDGMHKNGSLIPIEVAISSFDFKGDWHAVGSMRDTSNRRLVEEQLRKSEATSRALMDAPTDSATLIEPNGTIVAINMIGAKRLNASENNLVGGNFYSLLSSDQAESARKMIKTVVSTGKQIQYEDSKAGRRYHNSLYPVKNQDGTVETIAIFARDVTEQHKAKTALINSEQRFRDVSAAVGEFIWETDSKGTFQYITEDVVHVLGYTAEEIMGTRLKKYIPEEDEHDFDIWDQDVYKAQEAFNNIELRSVTKDGRLIWLQINGVPYFDQENIFSGFRGAAMNISDRKTTEEAIKASERKLRALADSAYDAIIMVDTNGYISFWNDAAENLFGYLESEALGRRVHDLIALPEDRAKGEKGMFQFAITGKGPVVDAVQETTALRKDGTTIPVERSVSGFRLGDSWYAVATIRDITERKATEAKLRELATTDSLTGLNNRRRFMELSEREFARSVRYERPLAMFMLDIDHFKDVNDTYGHDVGDDVLRSLAETAVMALRGADILGRLGGEEFGVLLPETDESSAMEVAERLRRSIENTSISTREHTLKITVSIGVSTLKKDTSSVQDLLKHADVALYDAKQSGRNRVIMG